MWKTSEGGEGGMIIGTVMIRRLTRAIHELSAAFIIINALGLVCPTQLIFADEAPNGRLLAGQGKNLNE